ncbi:hypothetical protein NKH37_15685 [Mesorhizobium sp. M1217]|uniref:hypothetical protein n=1 Tax=Mesorhizobium sp. M1217 TaxID=2957070 RepID=UPI00333510C4
MAAKSKGQPIGGRWIPETCSAADLAVLLGMGGRSVDRWIQRGVFVRAAGRGRFETLASIQAYADDLRSKAAGQASSTGKLLADERAETEQVDREIKKLKLAQIRGEVLTLEEVTESWTAFASTVKAAVLSIPGRLRSELPHMTAHDGETARRIAREVLNDLADEVETVVINGDPKEITHASL